jgi:hypothetical protein
LQAAIGDIYGIYRNMKKIAVSSLKEGQKFTEPVYVDVKSESLFIPEDTAIRAKDITLLSSLDVNDVFTEGALIDNADLVKPPRNVYAQMGKILAQKQRSVPVPKVFSILNNLVTQLKPVFSAVAVGKSVNIRLLWHITDTLMQAMNESRNDAMSFILCGDATGSIPEKNAIDTAILSMAMGQAFDLTDIKKHDLISAAILHDVGMFRLPESVTKKESSLSKWDIDLLRTHTIHSFNIMKDELMYPPYASQIVMQHHEHWDGSGYPRQLSGNFINMGSLIVSIADAFVAMINKKPYRDSMTGYQAMKTLVSDNSSYFSPSILKLFVKIMGIFPIGSDVFLNNGQIAKVIRINADSPLRPVILLLTDQEGKKIDLSTDKKLFITHAADIKE